MTQELLLVLIFSDGYSQRYEILSRFEDAGFEVVRQRGVSATYANAKKHLGKKDLTWQMDRAREQLVHAEVDFDQASLRSFAKKLYARNRRYVATGPLYAALMTPKRVLRGKAYAEAKRLRGSTLPSESPSGTIRRDFLPQQAGGSYLESPDSPRAAYVQKRGMYKMMHCSDSLTDARREVGIWVPAWESFFENSEVI